ncbi:Calvin cycle protein CP12-1, chloroplastic [Zea mays]|uniref:Calvin cycle protein CP12-1, chloroplastic n=1 Tax=Zea mays TaxID=4577 RepID=A0A317YAG8_MAIZE|nr:Calvin cycle protein CP12-1, chloroplastic [Zea mays]
MAISVTAVAALSAFSAQRSLPQPSRQRVVAFIVVRPVRAHRRFVGVAASSPPTPPDLAKKVSESIKQAQETCADDPVSGECVAAWDEVEELSAAASHLRDRQKGADPLEEYCKDNPETDECRTYED